VITVDDDKQNKEECLLHYFEFADDEDDWFEEVKIAGQAVVFKLDTGAQCNVLTKCVVDIRGGKVGNVRWRKYNRRDQIEVKNNKHEIIFKVIDENLKPILGRKTCEQLRLVMRVDYTKMDEEYDDLFSGD
jgi:hypothetical protein